VPGEAPFEEGDVVGIVPHPGKGEGPQCALTRRTSAAQQVGVISRRAVSKTVAPLN
jgi:hypothetical protein